MGKKNLRFLLLMIACCVFIPTGAKAQNTYGYSSIDYDPVSNVITAYAETNPDYATQGPYRSYVTSNIRDANGTVLASQNAMGSVSFSINGTGSSSYNISSGHYSLLSYFQNNVYSPCDHQYYSFAYYDPYNYMHFVESPTPDNTFSFYQFTGPGTTCYTPSPDIILGGSTASVKFGVGRIQYQKDSSLIDISGTLYVLKGTTVTFKAVPAQAGTTFPANFPKWSGSSGASGAGDTTSVTFNAVSSSTSDFKTVIATSGNAITVNVVVYDVTGVFKPEIEFTGRSYVKFGIEEKVSLNFAVTPAVTVSQIGGLRWKIVTAGADNGSLSTADDGTASYTAPDTKKAVVSLALQILAGPSKDGGPQTNIEKAEPSFCHIVRKSGLRHDINTWSVGFLGEITMTPTDVSFFNLLFHEGQTDLISSGWLAQPNKIHPLGPTVRITSTNKVQVLDEISTDAVPGPYGIGEWHWDIPWVFQTASGRVFTFTVRESATSDLAGTAVISKCDDSESRIPSNPTSYY